MGELNFYEWIALLVVILGLSSDRVIELFRNLGGRGGPGGPQHPLSVCSPVETGRATGHSEESRIDKVTELSISPSGEASRKRRVFNRRFEGKATKLDRLSSPDRMHAGPAQLGFDSPERLSAFLAGWAVPR